MNTAHLPVLPGTVLPLSATGGEVDQSEFNDADLAILKTAIPDKASLLSKDILAFWQALPRLLAGGQEGRFALVHHETVDSIWDSVSEARAAGHDRFGQEALFVTGSIKSLEAQRLRGFLAQYRAKQCPN